MGQSAKSHMVSSVIWPILILNLEAELFLVLSCCRNNKSVLPSGFVTTVSHVLSHYTDPVLNL
jgi:hypothetical protein